MKRNIMFTGSLNAEERAAIMRFAIEIGTEASFRTNALLRPFSETDLERAFKEKEDAIVRREKAYIESAKTFDPKKASPMLFDYLGGDVTPENYAKYVANLIKQEEEVKEMIRKDYMISVAYGHLTEEDLSFHKSLSPRVTFGDSNELHEECSFALTREIKDALLDSSLGSDPEEAFDYGSFYVGSTPLYYEDLEVKEGGEVILSTVSHEQIMDVFLCEDDFKKFVNFELNKARNRKIAEKLLS